MYRLPPSHLPPSSVPPTDDGDFLFQEAETGNLRDYWVIILKYRWTIVACLLLAILIAAIPVVQMPRIYTAMATLYFENPRPNIINTVESAAIE